AVHSVQRRSSSPAETRLRPGPKALACARGHRRGAQKPALRRRNAPRQAGDGPRRAGAWNSRPIRAWPCGASLDAAVRPPALGPRVTVLARPDWLLAWAAAFAFAPPGFRWRRWAICAKP